MDGLAPELMKFTIWLALGISAGIMGFVVLMAIPLFAFIGLGAFGEWRERRRKRQEAKRGA